MIFINFYHFHNPFATFINLLVLSSLFPYLFWNNHFILGQYYFLILCQKSISIPHVFFPHKQTHLTFHIQLFSITITYSSLFSSLSQRFYILKSKLGFVINVWNLFWSILCPPSLVKCHMEVSNLLFCLFFHHVV